ncbi:MAG: hypothetical protein ACYTFW_17030 [Planctomycetota bacterium]|jgi:hypothetical protein
MDKHTVRDRVLLVVLTLWLVHALAIISGCKKKDQPEDVQQAVGPDKIGTTEKFGLRILYVGLPDTERQKDFVEFLRKHFKQVDTADYNTFREEQTKDCDVAIFDKDGLEWKPLDINVSSQYSRATVSIGVPGAFWCRRVSSKMGYM